MHLIDRDTKNSRVTLTFIGEMKQDPKAFFAEFVSASQSVRNADGEWDLLLDFSQTHVMPQERAANTQKIFDWCLENGIRKTAFIMQSITQRLQIQRVTERHPKIEFFESASAAADWLDI